MSRPILKSPPPGERQWSPPDWDPDAVAADYLLTLGERADVGPLDPEWVDMLMTHLVTDLRSAYSPETVEAAVLKLQPLLERWEQYAVERHKAVAQEPGAETRQRWTVVRDVFARTIEATGLAARRAAKVLTIRRFGWRSSPG